MLPFAWSDSMAGLRALGSNLELCARPDRRVHEWIRL